MGQLILDLLPLALGVMLSPLALMALIAILVSARARVNGVFYLLGWITGLVAVMLIAAWIFLTLSVHEVREPPIWVAVVRIVVGAFVTGGAVWVYRKGHAQVRTMAHATNPHDVVEAAPQLPGWLQRVETFRPARSFGFGVGLFALNPVDASCAILASLELVLAPISTGAAVAVGVVFALLGILPIAVPVIALLIMGDRAQPQLDALRTWVAGHSSVLNAALLLVIGVLQLQKGLSALL